MQTIEDKQIYIDFPRSNSIKNYIINALTDRILYKTATYHDINMTKMQCHGGCNRSLSDLFYMVKTQYKTCTLEKFLKIYGELIHKLKIKSDLTDYRLSIFYCDDIHKFIISSKSVHEYNDSKQLFRISDTSIYRYTKDVEKGIECKDGFTAELLTKLMNYEKLHPISS